MKLWMLVEFIQKRFHSNPKSTLATVPALPALTSLVQLFTSKPAKWKLFYPDFWFW